jgi:general secretion pathway protein C
VRTTLPFNLVGTMILENHVRSLATIEDKSAQIVYPVRVDDEIPAKAKIVSIEAKKVVFVNIATGRREFVDIPEDPNAVAPKMVINARPSAAKGPGIEKLSATQFNISRNEVDKTLSDLNNVLTQARAVPNFENGAPAGYKLFQIVPGSIYDKLGLQNGDVIAGLNGNAINDPGKAFEMLSELKTQNHLELQVKKDGRTQTYSYDIR